MEINNKTIRFLSLLGHRGTFSHTMMELAKFDKNIFVLTADLADLTGLNRFSSTYSNRFLNIGIAEQNMIGIASGLSRYGFTVFATTYANFLTMRPYEQIRMNLGYMKHNVKLVGTGAGLSMGNSGNSHFGLEDISLMRSIPNMVVISPADCTETYKALYSISKINSPAYIRLSGPLNHPIIYKKDYNFQIGKAIMLKEGTDIIIFSTGTVTHECLLAASLIEEKGISTAVINMHTIKPLDIDIIFSSSSFAQLFVTVEEHSIIGGLGSAVSEVLSSVSTHPPLLKLGLPDMFGISGDTNFLNNYYRLTAPQIAEDILKFFI